MPIPPLGVKLPNLQSCLGAPSSPPFFPPQLSWSPTVPTTSTRRPADGKPGARQAVLCHLIHPEVMGTPGWPYTPLRATPKGTWQGSLSSLALEATPLPRVSGAVRFGKPGLTETTVKQGHGRLSRDGPGDAAPWKLLCCQKASLRAILPSGPTWHQVVHIYAKGRVSSQLHGARTQSALNRPVWLSHRRPWPHDLGRHPAELLSTERAPSSLASTHTGR